MVRTGCSDLPGAKMENNWFWDAYMHHRGSKGSFSWCIYAAPVQDDLTHLPLDKRGLPFRRQYFQMHYQNVIDWENGLLSARHQVTPVQSLIYFDVGFLSTRPMGMNFSEILIEMVWFSCQKMDFKMSSAKWYLFFLSLNVLNSP